MYKPYFIALFIFLLSCESELQHETIVNIKEKNSKEDLDTLIDFIKTPHDSIGSLKKEAIQFGSTKAYNRLSIIYMDFPPEDFLFFAMTMANKHDYPKHSQMFSILFTWLTIVIL